MTKGTKRKSKKESVEEAVVAEAPIQADPVVPAKASKQTLPPAKRLSPQNLLAELDGLASEIESLRSEIAELKSKL